MKTIIALAKLYKGVLIFETLTGFVIYNELGERMPFANEQAAEEFVDVWELSGCMLSQVMA